jgi:hypothetical protein
MSDTVCLDKTYIFMLMLALIFVGIYQYQKIGELNTNGQLCPSLPQIQSCPKCPVAKCDKVIEKNNDNIDDANNSDNLKPNNVTNILVKTEKSAETHPIIRDPVREYDYKKSYDPLEDPTRRVDRHNIVPVYVKQHIDMPTRGYPDNFHQLGILVLEGNETSDNKILRLFGRQEYPGSNRYEYYTAINSGHDQVKVPLDVKRGQELYDDDIVTISELASDFKVKLHKYDAPKYYPNIGW